MNTQKQILTIGIIFIVTFSIVFFNIRAEYKNKSNITKLEIVGMKQIVDIHNLDVLLKSVRGISQLEKEDAKSLKTSLFISDETILMTIKALKDTRIEELYNDIILKQKILSKMELFERYTKLLELLQNKRIDIADKYHLLFEAERSIYFLITTIVIDIPSIIENIGKIRGIGTVIISGVEKEKEKSLLQNNMYNFTNNVKKIKYIIEKLNYKDKDKLNSLLELILSDFYDIKIVISAVDKEISDFSSKEYFLEISKLFNKVNSLFTTANNMLTDKLIQRDKEIEKQLLIGLFIYTLLMIITLLAIYLIYAKAHKEKNKIKRKKEQHIFINTIQNDYIKEQCLKEICTKSLNHIIDYFEAINGTLYIFDEENKKLYLGATYGIKHTNVNQTLDIHENVISENIREKKIKIIDIDEKVSLGNIDINCKKLVTIPIMEFEKTIGTIQLIFDNKFQMKDMDFLQTIVSLMGAYIYKAQKEDESLRYLKMIDKNVLISKTDLDGNITEVSEQLCTLSLYKREELIGQNHRIFKHDTMPSNTFIGMWNMITKGQTWRGEIKNRKKDGGFYWIDSVISPDCDVNGNIIGYTAIRNDITDKKKVEQIAITDGLTSLYNRRHFDDIFPQQIEISKRAKGILAFVLMDIDHFKQYNDTYGHQEGDTTLKLVSKALKNTLHRPSDYTFRLGGEEFGLLYHIENEEDAADIANQARKNIENLKIEHTGNSASKYVTISSGLYIVSCDDNETVNNIYKKADESLYKAKQNGRNQVEIV